MSIDQIRRAEQPLTPEQWAHLIWDAGLDHEDVSQGDNKIAVIFIAGPVVLQQADQTWLVVAPYSDDWEASLAPEKWHQIAKHMEALKDQVRGSQACWDCAYNTIDDERFMVRDEVWAQAGMSYGHLCVKCLEERLGRALTASDFTDVPLNTSELYVRSERLRERLNATNTHQSSPRRDT